MEIIIISVFVWGIVWGVVAQAVVKNKGYEEEATKYFWLGFFFSFIPVIIAATKPNKNTIQPTQQRNSTAFDDLEKLAKLKEQGAITEEEYNKLKADFLARM